MAEIIELGIDPEQTLTIDETVAVVKRRDPINGIILFEDEEGNLGFFNFGEVSRSDALWFAEKLRLHSLGIE